MNFLGILPYFLLVLLVFFLSFNKKNSLKIIILLTLFSAMRLGIGSDYENYLKILNTYNLYQIERMEFANKLIIKMTYIIGKNEIFFMFYSILVSIFIFYGVKNFTKYKNEAILFFLLEPSLYLTTFGSVRQAVANSICFYALSKLTSHSEKSFFLWNSVAVLFHKSAFINFFIYLIYKLKIYRKKYIYFITFILLIIAKKIFLDFFVKIFNYDFYLKQTVESGHKIAVLFLIYSLLFFIIKKNISDTYNFLLYLSFSGSFIHFILSDIVAASRMGRYFYFPMIIVLAEYIYSFNIENSRFIIRFLLYSIFFSIFCIFLFTTTKDINGGTFVPYRTIFSLIFN